MTTQDAVKAIECNRPRHGYTILCEALDMAIEALEKMAGIERALERLEKEYRVVQTEYSEAKYLLDEMDEKDRNYISQNYRKDMNEGMCFAFEEAIEIIKQEVG